MNGDAEFVLFAWAIVGAAATGAVRVVAARKAARRTGIAFWQAYASTWSSERLAGMRAGVLWVVFAAVVAAGFVVLAVR